MGSAEILEQPQHHTAVQNYVSSKKRVIPSERGQFLSVVEGVGESADDLLARLRCTLLVKIKFISGLRDSEAKLRLFDGIRIKSTMILSKMTKSLQFRCPQQGLLRVFQQVIKRL